MNYIMLVLMFFVAVSGITIANSPTEVTPTTVVLSDSTQCNSGVCRRPIVRIGQATKRVVTAPARLSKRIIQNKPIRTAVIGTKLPTTVECENNCN